MKRGVVIGEIRRRGLQRAVVPLGVLMFLLGTLLPPGSSPLVGSATAQETIVPGDSCQGTRHGASSSIRIFGAAFDPSFEGGEFMVEIAGVSGDQMGAGPIGSNGVAFAEVPLFLFGPHQITATSVTTSTNGALTIPLSYWSEDGAFVVDASEPVCDETVLTPVAPSEAPELTKEFTDDPVEPGGTVTLEFTLTNSAVSDATAISFTDDLDSVLSGLTTVGAGTTNPCGDGSTLGGGSEIDLSGGSLLSGEMCSFSVELLIPIAAEAGESENTTSAVTAAVGGSDVSGDAASDTLTVTAAPVAPTTTPQETTAAPTTQAESTTTQGSVDDGGSSTAVFVVLIGVGIALILVALWWWRTFGIAPPWMWPCWPEYVAWQKAKRACEKAQADAKAKRRAAKKAAAEQKKADKKLKDHCKKYPPACGKPASITDVASGRTIDRDDLWVQSQWARDAWSKHGAGTQTAAQTEAQWKSPPDAAFDKAKRAELAKAKGETAGLEAAAKKAKADAQQAEADAVKAEAAAKQACDDAAKAKAAYDACIGKAAPAPGAGGQPSGTPGGGPGVGPGGAPPGGGGAGGKNCEPQRKAYEAAQKECDQATAKADAAEQELEDAEEAVEEAEEALEDYCEQYPPNCRDDSASIGDDEIRTKDVYLVQVWAEQVMVDFSTGQIDGIEAEQRIKDGPTDAFKADELQKLEDAKALEPGLRKDITDAKADVPAKKKAADDSRATADAACQKAVAAKKAFEACAGQKK